MSKSCKPVDPRVIGGRYLSGYWREEYTVLDIRDGWFTVQWKSGRVGHHRTAWDPSRDKILPEGALS